jgi:hypothetical protein
MKPHNPTVGRWYWLLLIPCLAILAIPFYNRVEPRLFGFPFFYWYQFLWVVLSSAITALVYSKVRKSHGEDEQ